MHDFGIFDRSVNSLISNDWTVELRKMQGNKCVLFTKPKGPYEKMRREGFAAGIAAGAEETRRMGHLLTYLAVKKDILPARWQTNPEKIIRFLHASSIDHVNVQVLDDNVVFSIRFDECLEDVDYAFEEAIELEWQILSIAKAANETESR